ncbi:MAG: hemerythrin domain-containing protein [Bacteroidales bacterium]|nr:hemerythrin domain-containing protein [Bacteroidales bacterium]
MIIKADLKMADVIHLNHYLISVINRFGITLGFGDQTILEVCKKHQINVDFFLEIVNAFHDTEYFPQKHLQSFPVKLIIEYLQKTHRFYLDVKIPEMESLIQKMVNTCYPDLKHKEQLIKFFNEYKAELVKHLKHEEELVFPYALKVEHEYLSKGITEEMKAELLNYSINKFKKEHDNLEEKPFDLKNIIIKYLPPPADAYLCSNVVSELCLLEKDLNDHARIEDKVMIPKIVVMENELKKRI